MKELGVLADHLGQRELDLPTSRRELYKAIRKRILDASNERHLGTGPDKIRSLVTLLRQPPEDLRLDLARKGLAGNAFAIVGGEKNQNRDRAFGHIERNDGAWFDFSIVAREVDKQVELLAYNFEIRLPPGHGAPFLRFDLNQPGHDNEEIGLRCHLHVGHDEVRVPAPMMTPLEILELFIRGLRDEKPKRRYPTQFEVNWLKETLDAAKTSP